MVQTHVTWGKNTVFNTPATTASTPPTSANKAPLFGAPTPATPATTSTTTSFFGASTPSAAISTNSAPSTTGGAFSFSSNPVSTPQTSATTSLFGTSTPGIGTPAPSTTGGFFNTTTSAATTQPLQQQQQQQQQQPMTAAAAFNPQQAALQAHLNATLYQESTRLESQLLQLHAAYSPYQATTTAAATGQPTSTPSLFGTRSQPQQPQPTTAPNETCRFQHIFYDRMTPAQKTEKISLGITTGHYPQKPNHIPIEIWNTALSRNPDSDEFIPVLITSAQGLHSRLVSQQSKMKQLEDSLHTLESTIEQMKHLGVLQRLENDRIRNSQLKRRLMKIMLKVDLCRGKNVALQPAENELMTKLWELKQNTDLMGKALDTVKMEGQNYHEQLMLLEQEKSDFGLNSLQGMDSIRLNDELKYDLQVFLKEKSDGIEALSKVLKKDGRDFGIIKDGIRKVKQ